MADHLPTLPRVSCVQHDDLVAEYLAAREPHDRDVLTPADAAGAVASVLALGRERTVGTRIVRVRNPSRAVDGWESPHTVVEVASDDAPFLVDSVSSALARRGYDIHLLFRPLLDIEGTGRTSHLHVEIDRETGLTVLAALREEIESVVDDVFAAVADWDALRRAVTEFADGLRAEPPTGVSAAETAEVATYLDWLADDHFTFVGAIAVDASGVAVPGSELGVACRRNLFDLDDTDAAPVGLLTLTRAQARSTVHRDVPLDSVTVRRLEADGSSAGELRLLGLYTANVFSDGVERIPVVRQKVAEVVERSGFAPDGHDGRALEHVLATYPRDELFRLPTDELAELTLAIVGMGLRRRVRLFVSRDRVGCFVSCLVFLPRDRYTTPVRRLVVDALCTAFDGESADFTVLVTEELMARLHVVVTTPHGAPEVDAVALEAELAAVARDWVDDLHDAFVDVLGEEAGVDQYRAVARRVPRGVPGRGVGGGRGPRRRRARAPRSRKRPAAAARTAPGRRAARIKLYRAGGVLVLSDVMPLLEHLGVTVVDEHPYDIDAPDGPLGIYSFGIVAAAGDPLADPATQSRVAEAFLGVWAGTVENDGLNRLVLHAGLEVRDVVIVRALCQYLRQAGVRFTDAYLADTLHDNAEVVRLIVARFHARLDPARSAGRRTRGETRRGCRARLGRGREPRRRPNPSRARAAGAGDGADERIPRRSAPRVQVRSDHPRLPAEAAPAARDLGRVPVGGGRAPPRRRHRPGRHSLVRPARGLPHRGPRADEGADGEERGHRAGGRQGRVLRQAG